MILCLNLSKKEDMRSARTCLKVNFQWTKVEIALGFQAFFSSVSFLAEDLSMLPIFYSEETQA